MPALFYENELEALRTTIGDSGKKIFDVAVFLWPGRKGETGASRLRNILNGGDEHLTFGEILAICRYCGGADVLYHMADELSHSRPQPITKETELAQLLRQWKEHQGIASKLDARIAQIVSSPSDPPKSARR